MLAVIFKQLWLVSFVTDTVLSSLLVCFMLFVMIGFEYFLLLKRPF